MQRLLLTSLLTIFTSITLCAKGDGVGVAFWDVESLYDTSPSLFYNDDAFTPEGDKSWSQERYNLKIANIAAVVDSMRLPIVMLYGVENEDVVRDIVRSTTEDYTYLHSTRNSLTGLDFALLYFGDILFIDRVVQRRDMLIVKGEIDGESITLVGAISAINFGEIADFTDGGRVVVMGHYDGDDIERYGLSDSFRDIERRGYGDTRGKRGWSLSQRASVGDGVEVLRVGIYIKEWLLTSDRSRPLATYQDRKYWGGYSNYLPIFLFFH